MKKMKTLLVSLTITAALVSAQGLGARASAATWLAHASTKPLAHPMSGEPDVGQSSVPLPQTIRLGLQGTAHVGSSVWWSVMAGSWMHLFLNR